MKVDPYRCVGCGNCVAVCPMDAIYVENRLAYINEDECVECGACLRFVTPENLSPRFTRLFRRTLSFFHLRYDQPIDMCPAGALYQEKLEWPRVLRQAFSDPTVAHASTGMKGRGTEEIKTNDVTGRLKEGEAGILIEFGRPGVGARFAEVEKLTTVIAPLPGRFEEKNPVTHLMVDPKTGALDPAILGEKILSCIVEYLVPLKAVPTVLGAIEETLPSLDTVISLVVNGRCGAGGEVPYEEMVKETSFRLSLNGKTNLGLGRLTEGA